MKYYVVSTTEDSGWEAYHETRGVKTSLEDALELMTKLEEEFKERHDFENTKDVFQVERTDKYVFFDCDGEWWYKIKFEEVE